MKISDCPSCLSSPSEFGDSYKNSSSGQKRKRTFSSRLASPTLPKFHLNLSTTRKWNELTKVLFGPRRKPSEKRSVKTFRDHSENRNYVYRKFNGERKHKIKKRDLVREREQQKQGFELNKEQATIRNQEQIRLRKGKKNIIFLKIMNECTLLLLTADF